MISFRYHVVSIVSVLLAVAVGVVLGSGPLRGRVDDTLVQEVAGERRTTDDLERELADLRSRSAFTDRFAATTAPGLVGGILRGHVVTLVVLPTAGKADVAGLREMVTVAGGSIGGVARVGRDMVDTGEKQLVDELGAQLEGRAPGVRVPRDAGTYERIGTLVGRAVGVRAPGGAATDATATGILAGLETAGLMSTDGGLDRRGDLVLLVTGAAEGSPQEQQGAGTILTSLARSVDAQSAGVVLAGPVDAARGGGPVAAVRADPAAARAVSTVDSLGGAAGAVVSVMALDGQAAGRTGHYGVADAADGAMPGAERTGD
jgi:hypothetical protein